MLEQLLQWDQETLLYLNNLGTLTYDGFWSFVTRILNWTPLFLVFFVLFLIKFPKRQALERISLLIVLVLTITGLCNMVKEWVGRLRPCNDESINGMMRILHTPGDFSFFSGHASSSFAVTVLVFLLLRERVKWAAIFFIWPLLFSYSRLYLGVHYPLDVIVGALVGTLLAWLFFTVYKRLFHPAQGQSVTNGQ